MTEFDEDWALLRGIPKSPLIVDQSSEGFQIECLLQRTTFEATQMCKKYSDTPSVADIVRDCVRTLIGIWKNDFKEPLEQLALIESVLNGYPDREADRFLQALPRAMVERLVTSAGSTANGTLAILAVELKRRDGLLGVVAGKSDHGHFYLSFNEPTQGTVTVYTSDSFQL